MISDLPASLWHCQPFFSTLTRHILHKKVEHIPPKLSLVITGRNMAPKLHLAWGICTSTEHKVPWASSLHPKWHVHRVSRLYNLPYSLPTLYSAEGQAPKLPLPMGDPDRYLIYGSLQPPKFTIQTASQPVHPFFQGPWLYQTDRHRDHATSVPTGSMFFHNCVG